MKGKKKDPEFISSFISDCIVSGKSTTNEFLDEAKKQISIIEEKIIEVEKLKKIRSKLFDVVETFEKKQSVNINNDFLSFYEIKNKKMAFLICQKIKNTNVSINNILIDNRVEFLFCIKQLVIINVINKHGDIISKGKLFDKFMEFGSEI